MLVKCVAGDLSVHENAVIVRYLDEVEKEDLSMLTNDRSYSTSDVVEVLVSDGLIVVHEIYCKPYDIKVPWDHVFKG